MGKITLEAALSFGNLVLSSTNVIVAFSLIAYILLRNRHNMVARAFCALLGFVAIVYVGDVMLPSVQSPEGATIWLRLQWLGIAFVPAAYFHLSDALLRTTNATSRLRRNFVALGYGFSTFLLAMALFSRHLVRDTTHTSWEVHFQAGPLFWVYLAFFATMMLAGWVNIWRVRRRSLTPTARRRMTYLAIAYAAPGLGVFPYLLLTSGSRPGPTMVLAISAAGNAAIAFMTVLLAYSVAYHGILVPDRVVKHDLIHYLLRGPLVGACLVVLMLAIPRAESLWGLPRDVVLIFTVAAATILLQLAVIAIKPFVDRLTYRGDVREITWLQELDRHVLTPADLAQLLENILIATCNLLQVRTGFVVALALEGEPNLAAWCGSLPAIRALLDSPGSSQKLVSALATPAGGEGEKPFPKLEGFFLTPLWSRSREKLLGVVGVEVARDMRELAPREQELVEMLAGQAELALEDRSLQEDIYAALERIIPEMETIQRWRSSLGYAGGLELERVGDIVEAPLSTPEFRQWVKDALSHYWGGPKLAQSPLLKLNTVQAAMERNGHSPIQALREVLVEAIEALRPSGERDFTAREWVLYNILEMRFVQGRKVREIAMKLALSEADLYRKQRAAIEEVSRVLSHMEEEKIGS